MSGGGRNADRDPAVNEPPTDLPDPPDIHRKRCEDPKEECSAKTPIKDRSQEDSTLTVPTVSKGPAADEVPNDPADPHDRKPEDHEETRTVEPPDKKESSEDPVPEDPAVGGDPAADEGPTDPLHRRRRPADPPNKKTISANPTADGDPMLKDPRDENLFTPLDRDPSEIATDSHVGITRKRKKKRLCEGKYIFSGQRKLPPPGTTWAAWARFLTLPALLMLLIRAVPSLVVIKIDT
ncbi:hypothetical protein E4U46_007585 [Claviceps purpurea]|nr:hypothetical protein E4U46_007585 [Claviceps purpurea]